MNWPQAASSQKYYLVLVERYRLRHWSENHHHHHPQQDQNGPLWIENKRIGHSKPKALRPQVHSAHNHTLWHFNASPSSLTSQDKRGKSRALSLSSPLPPRRTISHAHDPTPQNTHRRLPHPVATIPPSDDSKRMDYLPPHMRVPAAVASYSVCSGTMLLFNKLAMHYGTSCWGNDRMGWAGREGGER